MRYSQNLVKMEFDMTPSGSGGTTTTTNSKKRKRKSSAAKEASLTDSEAEAFLCSMSEEYEEIDSESDSDWSSTCEENYPNEPNTKSHWVNPPLINPNSCLFSGYTGLLQTPPGNEPMDFFNLLVDERFYEIVCYYTNLHAEAASLLSGKKFARIASWKPLTTDELRVFFGLLLHMGTIRINRIQDYWKKHKLFNLTCFSYYMGRNRFLLILANLYFANNPYPNQNSSETAASDDTLYKLIPIIDYFNTKMSQIYYPEKNLVLNENKSLKEGLHFIQNTPEGRSHRCKVKLFELTEPTGLTLKVLVNNSCLENGRNTQDVAATIAFKMLEDKLDRGHSLFLSDYFNSHNLACQLLARKTYCTGPLKLYRKGNCASVVQEKLNKGCVINKFDQYNGVVMGKWRDKKSDLAFLTTEFRGTLVQTTNKRGIEKQRPEAIFKYNQQIQGVEKKDVALSHWSSEKRVLPWYKKIALHLLQTMLFNSHILYNKYSEKKMSYYDFRLVIIEELLSCTKKKKPSEGTPVLNTGHLPSKFGMKNSRTVRKDCRICSKHKIRKMTPYYCGACPGWPGLCLEPCFKIWHCK